MAPVAAAVEVTAVSAALLGVLVGAAGGIVVWRLRSGLLVGGLAVAGVYVLFVIATLGYFWLRLAVFFGVLPLIQALLLSWLIARQLEARAKLRPLWNALAALSCTLVVGWLCLLSSRLDLLGPTWLAVGVIACLIFVSIARRKLFSR